MSGYDNYSSDQGICMLIPSLISMFACLYVMFVLYFSGFSQNNVYMEMIFYITICELGTAIGGSLGAFSSPNVGCWIQALITNYFPLAAIFWSTALMNQLYFTLLNAKKAKTIHIKFYIFCWVFPLVATLLPLTTNTYGPPYDDSWCFIISNKRSPSWGNEVWRLFGFYIWILLCVFRMIYLYSQILKLIQKIKSHSELLASYSSAALSKVKYYPIITALCWVFSAITDLAYGLGDSSLNGSISDNTASVASLISGAMCALVFFMYNPNLLGRHYADMDRYQNGEQVVVGNRVVNKVAETFQKTIRASLIRYIYLTNKKKTYLF
jgi:hypothetical protein